MKTTAIGITATVFVLAVAAFVGVSPEDETVQQTTTKVVRAEAAPPEASMTAAEREGYWEEMADARLTPSHQLHLSYDEQRIYEACVKKWLKARYASWRTGSADAAADAEKFAAEVERWDQHVADAQN